MEKYNVQYTQKAGLTAAMEHFKPFPGFGTLATHEGQDPEKWNSKAVVPPISMSTTFKQKAPGEHYVSVQ